MKPILTKTENSRRYANEVRAPRSHFCSPKTDCNYHTATFNLNGRCSGKRAGIASFRDISAGYFKSEARQSFAAEAALFSVIVLLTGSALISGAYAILNLVRSIGGL
jgi:hypothetical protein